MAKGSAVVIPLTACPKPRMFRHMVRPEDIETRIEQMGLPFNRLGMDPYGISKAHVAVFLRILGWFSEHYFRVRSFGLENVPDVGRAMLVGNHSGGIAIDAAMVLTVLALHKNPPRLAQGMADKFIHALPLFSLLATRGGQITGLPEHAVRLLEDERLLLVFPEGTRGTAKLYHERYDLVQFGTGFMRLALKTQSPIIPFGFLGGGAAFPTVLNLHRIAKLLKVPYLPVTAYGLPLPLPVSLEVHFGEPMRFQGTGDEDDQTIEALVEQVKSRIAELISRSRLERRRSRGVPSP